jgi:hypothetical protein
VHFDDGDHTFSAMVERFRVGFPFPALSLDWARWISHDGKTESAQDTDGLYINRGPFRGYLRHPQRPTTDLPVVPLIGFLPDAVLYGGLALLTSRALSSIRRRLRRARGRCTGCGYDLKGNTSTVCPECGVAPKREGVAEGTEEVPSASAPAQ